MEGKTSAHPARLSWSTLSKWESLPPTLSFAADDNAAQECHSSMARVLHACSLQGPQVLHGCGERAQGLGRKGVVLLRLPWSSPTTLCLHSSIPSDKIDGWGKYALFYKQRVENEGKEKIEVENHSNPCYGLFFLYGWTKETQQEQTWDTKALQLFWIIFHFLIKKKHFQCLGLERVCVGDEEGKWGEGEAHASSIVAFLRLERPWSM